MRISARLILGFSLVAFFTLSLGIASIWSVSTIGKLSGTMYANMTVPLGQLLHVAEDFQLLRVKARDLIFVAETDAEREAVAQEIAKLKTGPPQQGYTDDQWKQYISENESLAKNYLSYARALKR